VFIRNYIKIYLIKDLENVHIRRGQITDQIRIRQCKTDGIFHGRRPVGRPRLRWEDVRTESSLLLNLRRWRRLAGDKDIWRRNIERPGPHVDCRAIVEEEITTRTTAPKK
jgi:hypothetical protein